MSTYYDDLKVNASGAGLTNGHSYELFGYWHSRQTRHLPVPQKSLKTVLSYAHKNDASAIGIPVGTVAGPSRTWLLLDGDDFPDNNYPDAADNHGTAGINVTFCDGHSEWVSQKTYVFKYEFSQDAGRTGIIPIYGP